MEIKQQILPLIPPLTREVRGNLRIGSRSNFQAEPGNESYFQAGAWKQAKAGAWKQAKAGAWKQAKIVLAIQNPKSKIQNRMAQSGFTLMECLVAIAIVSILMTVVAPLITLSVSNRVQARRIEVATQAARAYVTGVESEIITPPQHIVLLNEVDERNNFVAQRSVFAGVAPPATNAGLSCPTTPGNSYCSNTLTSSLYCVDVDRNGCSSNSAQDLIVQAFRSATPNSTDVDKGYLIGVRVYRTDGFRDNEPLVKSDPENRRTQAVFTGGLGNLKAPLVEMSTEVVPQQATMRDFCDRFGCPDPQNISEE